MTAHRILVTGASSGIGAALAGHYAAAYGAELTLGLVARREERLQALAQRLGQGGTRVLTYGADVRDGSRMSQVAQEYLQAAGGIDVVVANAGLGKPDRQREGDPAHAVEMIETNLVGVLHTLVPFIPAMVTQGSGHLVGIGSLAGFLPLPGYGAYCGSKAGLRMMLDCWRPQLRLHGIRVTTICPGWVESEIRAADAPRRRFQLTATQAAQRIARAIAKGQGTAAFPWPLYALARLAGLLPQRLLHAYGGR